MWLLEEDKSFADCPYFKLSLQLFIIFLPENVNLLHKKVNQDKGLLQLNKLMNPYDTL